MPNGKRAFDLLICLCLVLPALFVTALASLLIVADTGTKPLFRQRRVGRAEQPFAIFKLRTMRLSTPDVASHQVDAAAAITRSGRLLRRLKIDEVPQLLNVVRGEMSLVGPRPCLPNQQDVIAARRNMGVDALVPGITGPAQVAGVDMSDPVRLAGLDATYLKPWSLGTDLRYLIETLRGAGNGDAAISSQ
jgi:O-antigen biosynthesis protein WbqP